MIYLKSPLEIDKIKAACLIIAELLESLSELIKPGVSTLQLDEYAEAFIRERGGSPAFKGYTLPGLKPFPGTLCTSVNDVIVHGIPSSKQILAQGDIIGIDVGVIKDGYYGDAAKSYGVGSISDEAKKLMETTQAALAAGIARARPKNRVGDISYAIGEYIASHGYHPADNLTGHGVGRELHEDPQIPNTGRKGYGPRLEAGMTLAIEPMVNIGTPRVKERGWEFFTADGSLSAHFEHTILITESGAEILTKK